MIEHYTKEAGHFKVGLSSTGRHILLQVQNKYGDQAREALTTKEVENIIVLLRACLKECVLKMNKE